MPPEEDRAKAIGNMYKKLVKIERALSGKSRTDKNTHRQTDTLITILRSPIGGAE